MNKILTIIITCCLSIAMNAQEQAPAFISPEIEQGIRDYLGLNESEPINTTQLDTITTLDLSRRGITDIHDLVLLPELRTVDLSDNKIEDLQPLTVLDSLRWVDLSYNSLKNINGLLYASTKELTANVGFNYIQDFSLFSLSTPCKFTLEGVGFQLIEDGAFFDVAQFICNSSATPFSVRGIMRTNMDEAIKLICEDEVIEMSAEEEYFKKNLQYHGTAATVVVLTNGELSDTTWLVPPIEYEVTAGAELTIATGLPENYSLANVYAQNGTITTDGRTIIYTAFDDFEEDVIYLNYYEKGRLRGSTEYYLVNPDLVSTLKGDVNNDRIVSIADVTAMVNNILGKQHANFLRRNADINGDGSVTIADVTALVNIILGKTGQ